MKTITISLITLILSLSLIQKAAPDSSLYKKTMVANKHAMYFNPGLKLDSVVSLKTFIAFYSKDANGISDYDRALQEKHLMDSINNTYEQSLYNTIAK